MKSALPFSLLGMYSSVYIFEVWHDYQRSEKLKTNINQAILPADSTVLVLRDRYGDRM
jgi:hypothetical protein